MELRFVYEAGSCGFVLCRHLRNQGIQCAVIAPSLIPQKASDHLSELHSKTSRKFPVSLPTVATELLKPL